MPIVVYTANNYIMIFLSVFVEHITRKYNTMYIHKFLYTSILSCALLLPSITVAAKPDYTSDVKNIDFKDTEYKKRKEEFKKSADVCAGVCGLFCLASWVYGIKITIDHLTGTYNK